jgi:hypothetical protein
MLIVSTSTIMNFPTMSVYADALTRATGRSVTETWIVLPVAAGAVQIAAGVP